MTNNMGKYMAAALLLLTACQPSTKVKQQEAENDNIQNPIITMRYSADPSARVFNDTLYIYPSHDRDEAQWWDMEDYYLSLIHI